MALSPKNPSPRLEKRPSVSGSAAQEVSGLPERGRDESGEEDDERPMSSFLPQVNVKNSGLRDLMSLRVWRNHVLWRAGVSVLKGERISTNHRIFFPDHRGNSFRVTQLCVRSAFRHPIKLATLSCARGDPLWQRHPRLDYRLRHGFSNRGTHQPSGDDSHCALRTLPSRSSNNIRLLSARRRRTRWSHPPRSHGQETRIRNSQRWLLDRPRRGG